MTVAGYAPRPQAERGFVLVAVLGVLVILSLLAASVGVVVQRLRDQQLERQRQFAADLDRADTRATVLYLLTTQRMTFGGLTVDRQVALSRDERSMQGDGDDTVLSYMPVGNEVALDGTAFRGRGDARFALQDDRGLIAVNWSPPAMVSRYLAQTGASSRPYETLANLLQDYQDPDDLYRLNSAERDEYVKRGRPPPTNHALATPLELRRVIGWDEALAGRDDLALATELTVVRSAQINVNTAPADVLAAIPGVDRGAAARVVALRALRPFVNLSEFRQAAGLGPTDDDLLSLYPTTSGTLRLWSRGGGTVQLLHWTLTPRDDGGRPWREDYEFTLPADERTTRGDARPVAAKVFAAEDAASK